MPSEKAPTSDRVEFVMRQQSPNDSDDPLHSTQRWFRMGLREFCGIITLRAFLPFETIAPRLVVADGPSLECEPLR